MAYDSEDKEREIRANQKEILDLSNQINRSFEKRKDLVGTITDKEREYKSLVSESNRLSQQIASNAEKIANFQIKSKDLSQSISKAETAANDAARKFADIQKTLTRDKISASINFNAARSKERDLSNESQL
jgi:predicted  nucleic acid-binding Zn-ribbon protein